MNEPLIVSADTDKTQIGYEVDSRHPRRTVRRAVAPIAVVLAALSLNVSLLFATSGHGVPSVLVSRAQAASLESSDGVQDDVSEIRDGVGADDGSGGGDSGEDIKLTGRIDERPQVKVGTWVISATAYTVTDETEVSENLEAGDCVEVRSHSATPTVAYKISDQESSACDNQGEGSGGGGGEGETIETTGFVSDRPIEKVGTWVISDTVYSVTQSTIVDGAIVEGDCVEVRSNSTAPTHALKVVKLDEWKCEGDDEIRSSFEGIVVSYPASLLGAWTISIGENRQLTFTASADTNLNPQEASAYRVGGWVTVRVVQKLDGSYQAESVRADDHEMGELVVRLASSAYSYTLASKYQLVLQSTLLNDANIYLYLTNSEHEQELASLISQEQGVIWAEVNYVNSVPEDNGYKTWGWGGKSEPDEYSDQSAFLQIRVGEESRAYSGQGVVVAILDTGVYTRHEQFAGKLRLPSLDVIDDDDDPTEVGPGLAWGHGTHVAGIISAMAPRAQLLPIRVLDENGRGNTFLLAYAIEWATRQQGVKVINLSLGTGSDSRILHEAIENAIEQGILVVAAAGNDNTNLVQYPAGYEDVIAVTALDSASKKAAFANYGHDWVDVSAPGVGIMSTMISEDGPGYASWSGTSMATAFVSGAAALVAEKSNSAIHADVESQEQLTTKGLVVDALNPEYAGALGRQLDVSAALGVNPTIVFVPEMSR